MPKRFTETLKWDDPWFRALSPDAKLLWFWLVDKCDSAGIIEPDFSLCEFQTGIKKAADKLPELTNRIGTLENGKMIVVKFIEFQQGKLSRDCKAHNPIFQSLEKNGMIDEGGEIKGYSKGIHTLSTGYPMGLSNSNSTSKSKSNTLREKKENPTLDEVREFCSSIDLPDSDGDYMFYHWEENGWTNNKKPVLDWRATIRKWKSAKYLPSTKTTSPAKSARESEFAELILRVNKIHPTWQSPSSWNDSELRVFNSGAAKQMNELSDDDWKLLGDYYLAKPDAKSFWQPHTRSKFVETFPDVWQGCQRWQLTKPKTITRDSESTFY